MASFWCPAAWSGLLPRGSVVIASARPLNEVRLRADVILRDESQAQRFTEEVATYLVLFKSLEISMDEGGPDKDVKPLLTASPCNKTRAKRC